MPKQSSSSWESTDLAAGEGVPGTPAKGLAGHRAMRRRTGNAKGVDGVANDTVHITRQTFGTTPE
jgi:hypothetical protein